MHAKIKKYQNFKFNVMIEDIGLLLADSLWFLTMADVSLKMEKNKLKCRIIETLNFKFWNTETNCVI